MTSTDPRLVCPLWRGRRNVDALTIACIERAEEILGGELVITQGSYQDGRGDENSAGTHDGGGVVDISVKGKTHTQKTAIVLALRRVGMAAWLRTTAQGPWVEHIHAVVIGHPLLSRAAAAQVYAYLAGRNGLANNGIDDGPRLDPIPRPVWPWPKAPALPKRIRRYLAETAVELARLRAARKAARLRGEPVEPYRRAIKKLKASRRAAKSTAR